MLEIFMESVVGGEVGRLGVGLKEGGGDARRMCEVGTKLTKGITGELKARKWP